MSKLFHAIRMRPQKQWYVLLTSLATCLILYCAIHKLDRINRGWFDDFRVFYSAARALILGNNPYLDHYIYPPFFAFMITPLAHYSEKFACIAWLVVNIALLILILTLGFRMLASVLQLKFTRWQAVGTCALAVLLLRDSIWWEFKEAQTDLFILAGFTLGLFWMERKPYIAGICLGVVANIKYLPLFFLPFLLFRGRWRIGVGLIAGVISAALLPALMIGWERNIEYLAIAVRGMITIPDRWSLLQNYMAAPVPNILWVKNISITASLARIFLDHGWPERNAFILAFAIFALMFFGLWSMFRRYRIPFIWRTPQTLGNPQQERLIIILEWSAVMIGVLIFSPQCILRHLLFLLNVNLLAAVMLFFPRPNVKRWPVLAGVLIVQFERCIDVFIVHGLFHSEKLGYFGSPAWSWLIALPLLISGGLAYCCDVYRDNRLPAQPKPLPADELNHAHLV